MLNKILQQRQNDNFENRLKTKLLGYIYSSDHNKNATGKITKG